jgi:hypothetical protein
MKTYYLPFVTITEGVYTIPAASLEDAVAKAKKGFPYELGETIIHDENTSWDFNLLYEEYKDV